jgi:tRNA threonylcarbamoyladenosine biosynthesis protein TsaE
MLSVEDPDVGIDCLEVRTKGPIQTLHLGRVLGRILPVAAVVALMGDLGAGKTVLAKGIAEGLGVKNEQEVTSPTFVLINEYQGRVPVHHLDLYRLNDFAEMEDLGWEELLYGKGVTIIEWAEKMLPDLPEERIDVFLQWIGPEERKIIFRGKGKEAQILVNSLREIWKEEG